MRAQRDDRAVETPAEAAERACGRLFLAGMIAAAALQMALVLARGGIFGIDAAFLPDDTYYTLTIARNLAAGLGPSVDGVMPTTGFQPLIAFLLVPVFWLGGGTGTALAAAIALSGLFGVLSVGLMGRIAAAEAGRAGLAPAQVRALAATVMALAATAPALVSNALNGLETTLAAFLVLVLLRTTAAMMSGKGGAGVGAPVMAGIVAGFALLARVDACFAVGIAGAWVLLRAGPVAALAMAAAALAVVAPWWGYSIWLTGSPVPESGAAVREIVAFHQQHHLSLAASLRRALGSLALIAAPAGGVAGLPLGAAALAMLSWAALAGWRGFGAFAALAGASLAVLALYALYLPAFWFFDRYFHLVYLAVIGAGALGAARIVAARPERGLSLMLIAAFLLLGNAARLGGAALAPGGVSPVSGQARGYGAAAAELLAGLPAGTVLGAMQSGALGYLAPPGTRVVNLDGVVNRAAQAALRDRALGAYAGAEGLTHFADWDLNRAMLGAYWGAGEPPLVALRQTRVQGADRFTLYRLGR